MIISPRPRRLSESGSTHTLRTMHPQSPRVPASNTRIRPNSVSGVTRTRTSPVDPSRPIFQMHSRDNSDWYLFHDEDMSEESSAPPSPPLPELTYQPAPAVTIVHAHDSQPCDLPVPLQDAGKMPDISNRRLIVVLERASLEPCWVDTTGHHTARTQTASKCTLLNCDEHQKLLMRMGREISEARPDITHQCLLTLLDSPLNKAGLLQIYIHTSQRILIEVHPDVRIPRTFKRFSGLIVQLLQRGAILGASDSKVLLRIINGPLDAHIPHDAIKIALTGNAAPRRLQPYLRSLAPSRPIAIFVGAMARGPDNFAEHIVDGRLSISKHALSASVVCGKFCCALEDLWDIV
ncbi:Alpha/beta knot methyltransferase [Sparassis latifolia]